MLPTCPDCGTTLDKRYHFISDHELPYWVCPKCHDLDITLEFADVDTMTIHRYAYKDGHFLVVPKGDGK